nr:hypothetical protein [uncultured Desulfobacter sp.]
MFGLFKKKKKKPFVPPEIPSYPFDYNGIIKAIAPYYSEERPLDFFFEMYVIDVLGELPEVTISALDEFSTKHPTFFAAHNGDWRQFVVKESRLSNTIDVAIWDLWIRNLASAKKNGWDYHPWHYAQNFADNYFADKSRVDVWEGNALQEAKLRIEKYRKFG